MATVRGGFWENNGGTYNWPISTTSTRKRMVAFALDEAKMDRALMIALNGVVPGAVASDIWKRVAPAEDMGGARIVETATNINRVTTAADVADLLADVYTYGGLDNAVNVPNLDGNPLGTR
jgi:hypothetical protein